jgi:putative membrane protein
LSQLGGFIMGARAATLLGLSGITAFASTIVDVTVEMVAQLGFTAIGLAILKWQRPDDPLIDGAAVGVIVALVGAIGFIIAQRRGFAIADRVAGRLAAQWLKTAAARSRLVHDEIVGIYRRPKAIWLACLLHLAAWVAGSLQVWFALRLMGADVGIPAVIAIESLLYAIRSAAFFVPNALGVQEGAYIMLGGLFGVPPDIALALSLLKRARDLVVGVPSLVAWQAMESRRLMRNRAAETLQAGETRSP